MNAHQRRLRRRALARLRGSPPPADVAARYDYDGFAEVVARCIVTATLTYKVMVNDFALMRDAALVVPNLRDASPGSGPVIVQPGSSAIRVIFERVAGSLPFQVGFLAVGRTCEARAELAQVSARINAPGPQTATELVVPVYEPIRLIRFELDVVVGLEEPQWWALFYRYIELRGYHFKLRRRSRLDEGLIGRLLAEEDARHAQPR